MVLLAQRPAPSKPKKESVEIMIVRNCLGPTIGKEGLHHLELGSKVRVTEEDARQLCLVADAARYMQSDDDPHPAKIMTLTQEQLQSVQCQVRLNQQRDKQREEDADYALAVRRQLIAQHVGGKA